MRDDRIQFGLARRVRGEGLLELECATLGDALRARVDRLRHDFGAFEDPAGLEVRFGDPCGAARAAALDVGGRLALRVEHVFDHGGYGGRIRHGRAAGSVPQRHHGVMIGRVGCAAIVDVCSTPRPATQRTVL